MSHTDSNKRPTSPNSWVALSFGAGAVASCRRGFATVLDAFFPPPAREIQRRERHAPHQPEAAAASIGRGPLLAGDDGVARRFARQRASRRGLSSLRRAIRGPRVDPRRVVVGVGFVAIASLTIAAIIAYSLSRGVPSWWTPAKPIDPQAGEMLENAIVRQLSSMRPTDAAAAGERPWRSEAWTVSMTEDDANAWLNTRLRLWLANRTPPVQWPAEVRELRVRFLDGRLMMGAEIVEGGRRQVVAASVRPTLRDDGSFWLPADQLDVGSLPVPPGAVLGWLREATDRFVPGGVRSIPELDVAYAAIAGERALVKDAVVRVDGGRRVRLLRLVSRDGWVEITCRTEQAGRDR